jgi:hypothetical protein
MDMGGSYDDMGGYGGGSASVGGASTGGGGGSPVDISPVDGSDEGMNGMGNLGVGVGLGTGVGGTMNILGKTMATNNFVTKLYQ